MRRNDPVNVRVGSEWKLGHLVGVGPVWLTLAVDKGPVVRVRRTAVKRLPDGAQYLAKDPQLVNPPGALQRQPNGNGTRGGRGERGRGESRR